MTGVQTCALPISPSGFNVPFSQGGSVTTSSGLRDNPGIYADFGAVYLRKPAQSGDPSLPGVKPESMPSYEDYASSNGKITAITDNWTPLLDEFRYCKHIYALKFGDGTPPPEPSDFPVGMESMAEWEQKLTRENDSNQIALKGDRKSTRLNSSHIPLSRMPSSA